MVPVRVYVFPEVCECLEKRVAEHYTLMLWDRAGILLVLLQQLFEDCVLCN